MTDAERVKQSSENLTEQEAFWKRIGWTSSDFRPSAIAAGTVVGFICFITPFVLLVCVDLPALHRDLRGALHNIRGKKTHKKRKKPKQRKTADNENETDVEPRRSAWSEEVVLEDSEV